MNEDNDLLNKLREKKPDDLQIHKWKTVVQHELEQNNSKSKYSLGHLSQLLASACIGIAIGAFIFSQPSQKNIENAEIDFDDATTEVVYTKL